jgi:hypothetical protein
MDVSAFICTELLNNSTFFKIKNDVILDGIRELKVKMISAIGFHFFSIS